MERHQAVAVATPMECLAGDNGINRLRRYDERRRLSAQDDEAGPSMKIEKAEVIVTSPDRNFVTLRLETDDGIVGLGDGTLNGRELAVVSYLREHVAPLLI